MEKSMTPGFEHKALFDNNKLFDQKGHLTDAGLLAARDGALDELGSLEVAEHLTFCDYCLARFTTMMEGLANGMNAPMRDLIPQVQALMRRRSFRVLTNRYVSAVAAVVLAFTMWQFTNFLPVQTQPKAIPQAPKISVSQMVDGMFSAVGSGVSNLMHDVTSAAQSGLAQLADPGKLVRNGGKTPADGE